MFSIHEYLEHMTELIGLEEYSSYFNQGSFVLRCQNKYALL